MGIRTSREYAVAGANGERKRSRTQDPVVLPHLHLHPCTPESRLDSRCQASVGHCGRAMKEACAGNAYAKALDAEAGGQRTPVRSKLATT